MSEFLQNSCKSIATDLTNSLTSVLDISSLFAFSVSRCSSSAEPIVAEIKVLSAPTQLAQVNSGQRRHALDWVPYLGPT